MDGSKKKPPPYAPRAFPPLPAWEAIIRLRAVPRGVRARDGGADVQGVPVASGVRAREVVASLPGVQRATAVQALRAWEEALCMPGVLGASGVRARSVPVQVPGVLPAGVVRARPAVAVQGVQGGALTVHTNHTKHDHLFCLFWE